MVPATSGVADEVTVVVELHLVRGQNVRRLGDAGELEDLDCDQPTVPRPLEPGHRLGGKVEQRLELLARLLDGRFRVVGSGSVPLLARLYSRRGVLGFRLLIASADKAREMGIDWWQGDPFLSRGNGQGELEERLRKLEEKAGLPTTPQRRRSGE